MAKGTRTVDIKATTLVSAAEEILEILQEHGLTAPEAIVVMEMAKGTILRQLVNASGN